MSRPDRSEEAEQRLADSYMARAMPVARAAETFAFLTVGAMAPDLGEVLRIIRSGLGRIPGRGPVRASWETKEYARMMRRVREKVTGAHRAAVDELKTRATAFAKAEVRWQDDALEDALRVKVTTTFGGLTRRVVSDNFSAFRGQAKLSEWFKGIERKTANSIDAELREGLRRGETVDQMVRRIRGREVRVPGQPRRFEGGVYQTTTREATTIARTYANHATTTAREHVFAAHPNLVLGVILIATLDAKTSDICKREDQQIYPINEGPRPPLHPRCRTTVAAKITEDPLPGTRASAGGQVPATWDYDDWLRRQTREVQVQALGVRKAELFRAGKISRRDLVDPSGRALPVAELEALAAER